MLSKDILENINNLIAVTSSINETYTILKGLETNDKKESNEYKSAINGLKSSLDLEKSIYDRFPKDLSILTNIDQKITESDDFWISFNVKDNINAVLLNFNLVKRRIHLKLFNKMLELKNADFVLGISDPEFMKNQTARNILIINNLAIKDYINTILTILNTFLHNEKYKIINNLLLNVKYGLAFLYDNVENDLLDNNFNINSDLYWENTAIADFYHLDREKLTPLQKGVAYDLYCEKINNIIKIALDDKSDAQEIFEFVISEIIVRASLLFLGDEVVENFKKHKLELSINSPHDEIGLKILKDAQQRVDDVYAKYDKDKELKKVISLKVR